MLNPVIQSEFSPLPDILSDSKSHSKFPMEAVSEVSNRLSLMSEPL